MPSTVGNLTVRTKHFESGTHMMVRPARAGEAAVPVKEAAVPREPLDRILLLYGACNAARMAHMLASQGDEETIQLIKKYSSMGRELELLCWVELALNMGATRHTFVFKAGWLQDTFARLGQGQVWRCRWERLCGSKTRSKKKSDMNINSASRHVRLLLNTLDVNKVFPPLERGDHALSKWVDITFEEMWELTSVKVPYGKYAVKKQSVAQNHEETSSLDEVEQN
jgi:hypothetical protein